MIIKKYINPKGPHPGVKVPDQFVSASEKEQPSYIKGFVDYYADIATQQYQKKYKKVKKKYDLVKGILTKQDYYDIPEVKSFIDTIVDDELPPNVVHYSLMNQTINTLVGEESRRPDQSKVKSMDENSKNEQFEFRNQQILEYLTEAIQGKYADLPPEELEQRIGQELSDKLNSYTSKAEKWANKKLNSCKLEFNLKDLSGEAFRDLAIAAEEHFHIYEDSSRTGFNIEVVNAGNKGGLGTQYKYTSDPTGSNRGEYASWIISVKEISELIERYRLSKQEVDHLRNKTKETEYPLGKDRTNLFSNQTGVNTIEYDTYYPGEMEEALMNEANIIGGDSSLDSFLGINPSGNTYGSRFIVVEGYVLSKKKIGKVTYIDAEGDEQVIIVDESYTTIPNEMDVEWGWINQWYKFVKIGSEIYHLEPFECFNYNPIIGVTFEAKNTEAKSIVDLQAPWQILFNVCMNQVFEILANEIGVVASLNRANIPIPKDGDPQDALDAFVAQATNLGFVFEETDPETIRAVGAQPATKAINLSQTEKLRSRLELASFFKEQCNEIVGISRQRQGSTLASETATSINTAMSQSYAQTEPLFIQHEYVLNQVYQAIVDMAQYIEVNKGESSTLSYLNDEGDNAFIKMNREEFSMRDLKVFVTSRAEDQRIFSELKSLAGAMLQNGASPYDVSILYSTNSVRLMQDTFKRMKDKQDEVVAQNQQIEQQKIEQANQAVQAQIEAQQAQHLQDQEFEGMQNELDRLSKERISITQALGYGKVTGEDSDNNGVADALQIEKLGVETQKLRMQERTFFQEQLLKNQQHQDEINMRKQELAAEKERTKVQLQIAKMKPKSKK